MIFRVRITVVAVTAALAALFAPLGSLAAEFNDLRIWNSPERTRIVFDLKQPIRYTVFELDNPSRVVVDIKNTKFDDIVPIEAVLGQIVETVRPANHDGWVRFAVDLKKAVVRDVFELEPNELYGYRLVLDLYAADKAKEKKKPNSAPIKQKKREEQQDFVVVIDPGHGGEDPGAVGANKTLEKKLVLKISKKLEKALNDEPGIKAVLTRTGDYYISLDRRTELAAELGGDLFVSIHADAFTKRSASGISIFALSETGATSERARAVAQKENSSDRRGGVNLSDKSDAFVYAWTDLGLAKHIPLAIDLGRLIRKQLGQVGKLHGHDVERAKFFVLRSPMPALLVEVGFISNPREEKKLRSGKYQDKLVRGIKHAVIQYKNKNPRRL